MHRTTIICSSDNKFLLGTKNRDVPFVSFQSSVHYRTHRGLRTSIRVPVHPPIQMVLFPKTWEGPHLRPQNDI